VVAVYRGLNRGMLHGRPRAALRSLPSGSATQISPSDLPVGSASRTHPATPLSHPDGHTMTIAPQPAAPSQPSRARTLIYPVSAHTAYHDTSDLRADASGNQHYSGGGQIRTAAGERIANYGADDIFSPDADHAHRQGHIDIHHPDMLAGYCAG